MLQGVDLDREPDESASILGESTLMSIIDGLDRRFEGMVRVNERLFGYYDKKTMSEYRRVTVGHIPRICSLSHIDAFAVGCRDRNPEQEKAAARARDGSRPPSEPRKTGDCARGGTRTLMSKTQEPKSCASTISPLARERDGRSSIIRKSSRSAKGYKRAT